MVSGCSLVRGNENFDKKTLEQQTDNFLTSWFAADFEGTISTYKDQMNDTTLAQYKLYAKQKAQYKGLKKKEKTEFTITTDSATVTETILCESGDKVLASLTFDKDGQIQTDDSRMKPVKIEKRAHIDGAVSIFDALAVKMKYHKEIGRQLQNAA